MTANHDLQIAMRAQDVHKHYFLGRVVSHTDFPSLDYALRYVLTEEHAGARNSAEQSDGAIKFLEEQFGDDLTVFELLNQYLVGQRAFISEVTARAKHLEAGDPLNLIEQEEDLDAIEELVNHELK